MRTLRLSWVSLSLWLSLFALVPSHTVAQSAPVLSVISSNAEADFPTDMQFDLKATTGEQVDSIDLVYREANLDTLELLPATFKQSGNDVSADAGADFTVNFLPVGIDLTYHWAITFDDQSVFETDEAAATWIDSRFDWKLAKGTGVEIYSYDRSQSFVDYMVKTSEEAVVAMTALYQPESTFPIRIWAYESGKDYAGTLAANSQEWSAGSAYPDLQVIQAVIPDGSKSEVDRVLPHEVSHQILHMATLNPFNQPATWIDEGLATHAQIGGVEDYPAIVSDALAGGDLLSLRSLISSFPYDSDEARLAYAESYSATGYISDRWGDDGVRAIVRAYREGNSQEDVIETALGMTLDQLQAAWTASVEAQSRISAGPR
jgi:hypothetical protein